MSWADYVNAFLLNYTNSNTAVTYQNIAEAGAIISNSDGTIWAASNGFSMGKHSVDSEDNAGNPIKIEVDEFTNLKMAFDNNGETPKNGGIRINNEKYLIVSFDKDKGLLYLKKQGGGAAVAKSNLAFSIAIFSSSKEVSISNGKKEPQNPGIVNLAVEALQDFLVSNSL